MNKPTSLDKETNNMLRDLLNSDFDIDLPISGGMGNAESDPIVIETDDPQAASLVQMQVARCIYGRLGFHWKVIDKSFTENPEKWVEKLTSENVYPEGDQLITERRALYFDISASQAGAKHGTPYCVVPLGELYGIRLPYELGWLHFDGLTDYEERAPGLGISAAYSNPSAKATIYVYNKGNPIIDFERTPDLLHSEMNAAVGDLLRRNPNAKESASRQHQNVFFMSFEIDDTYSAVMLSALNNQFFKVRATLSSPVEKYNFDCLMQSLSFITSLLTPRQSVQ